MCIDGFEKKKERSDSSGELADKVFADSHTKKKAVRSKIKLSSADRLDGL